MKQVVFISGKGGTGKSTIVSSLGHIVENKMLGDCDVDAPNLHLLLSGREIRRQDYTGSKVACIDQNICTRCGLCRQTCRFAAIDEAFTVQALSCEGCGACRIVCPAGAISLNPVVTGQTFVSDTAYGLFAHARLRVGAEGSGKLVTEVRKSLQEAWREEEWILIDGAPGVGCVVIASITGTDAVVAVTEPTQSGRQDLERVLQVADHFKVPACVCINKCDINPEVASDISGLCRERQVPVIGRIPFDPAVVSALQQSKTPVEASLESIVEPIRNLWENLVRFVNAEKDLPEESECDDADAPDHLK